MHMPEKLWNTSNSEHILQPLSTFQMLPYNLLHFSIKEVLCVHGIRAAKLIFNIYLIKATWGLTG